MIATTTPNREELTLALTEEIHVKASPERTFESLLEMLGPGNVTTEGQSLSMKIEPWPGGRWYRDLGKDNGHFWAHVQAIKRPTLLEFTGPLFMSFAVTSNLQYRLTPVDGGTLITFKHTMFGFIPDDFRTHMPEGWRHMHKLVREHAEKA